MNYSRVYTHNIGSARQIEILVLKVAIDVNFISCQNHLDLLFAFKVAVNVVFLVAGSSLRITCV